MDKNTATGFVLIFLLMLGWFYFTMPSEEELANQRREQAVQDSLAQIEQNRQDSLDRTAVADDEQQQQTQPREQSISQEQDDAPEVRGLFASSPVTEETEIEVTTPLYTVTFTNRGAGPNSFILNNYDTWDGRPVQLIADTAHSAYNIGFLSTENYNVETQNILFEQVTPGSSMAIASGEQREIRYELELQDGREVILTYLLNGNNYEIDVDVQFVGLQDYVVGRSIDFGWTSPLRFTEKDHTQDALATSAYVYAGGELEQFKLDEAGREETTINGNIDWAATKTKFFTQLIKPMSPTDAAMLIGEVTGAADNQNTEHRYRSSIRTDLDEQGATSFQLYVGPMKYREIVKVDDHAYDMVDIGWSWLRWFSDPFVKWLVIPFFEFLSGFISNFGVIIIVFAALVKLVLSPLTYKSYKSMAAMGELQPQMKEIQEKYKDNPQKQQKATMDLYRKNKVNPLGGCLPNLLQFPILITLWRYFQNSILIRQEEFLWATDLSAPDYILSLPFSIPFLGEQIAGFVLLMTAAMVVQSKLTGGMSGGGGSSPMAGQMKMLQYIFPVMLLFIFNNFAAGLSLYYLVFNVLSIIQQFFIKRSLHGDKEEAKA
ncbi:MAG: membrane protein insertase YidC [Gracilimonas sp.]|uniref:membrane protein insertase YidC n=1 Tax=Gracilimonas sp. TaxID=1974203 RepID=UPI001B169CFA|nr:membrane protein insertase YidC [Gracilimonas sp.]MBO6584506.1 membrane protein insertase YidC [Gracilimonas sp.]MBO6616223.1 membrane protein insertase YidC [Gracilimonas sp.]